MVLPSRHLGGGGNRLTVGIIWGRWAARRSLLVVAWLAPLGGVAAGQAFGDFGAGLPERLGFLSRASNGGTDGFVAGLVHGVLEEREGYDTGYGRCCR